MKRKRIYLNTKKTKYCIAELHRKNKTMQVAYDNHKSNNGKGKVLGAHCGYEKYTQERKVKLSITKKKGVRAYRETKPFKLSPETGIVFLSLENCGAGIVSHEIAHAVLWAYKHKKYKKQYPIKIRNMKEEEEILHNLTYAVQQFYNWYWKIKSIIN